MNLKSRILTGCLAILFIALASQLMAQSLDEIEKNRVSLPNGWQLTPVGKMIPAGDLPLNIAISPNKKQNQKHLKKPAEASLLISST